MPASDSNTPSKPPGHSNSKPHLELPDLQKHRTFQLKPRCFRVTLRESKLSRERVPRSSNKRPTPFEGNRKSTLSLHFTHINPSNWQPLPGQEAPKRPHHGLIRHTSAFETTTCTSGTHPKPSTNPPNYPNPPSLSNLSPFEYLKNFGGGGYDTTPASKGAYGRGLVCYLATLPLP